jgi:hypothetical protein
VSQHQKASGTGTHTHRSGAARRGTPVRSEDQRFQRPFTGKSGCIRDRRTRGGRRRPAVVRLSPGWSPAAGSRLAPLGPCRGPPVPPRAWPETHRRTPGTGISSERCKQTPCRGHPVFVAQHATACCCRACLEKFRGIPTGRALTPAEQDHVIAALERWLRAEEGEQLAERNIPEGG